MTPLSVATQGLLDRGALPALTIAVQGFLREAEAVPPTPGQESGSGGGGPYRERPEYFGRGATGDPGGPRVELEQLRDEAEAEDKTLSRADALRAMDALDLRLVAIEAVASAQDERTAEIDALIDELAQSIALRRAMLLQRMKDEEFLLMASV